MAGEVRQSLMITQEQLDELKGIYDTIDCADGSEDGYINVSEVGSALDVLGYRVPPYQVRDYIRDYGASINNDRLNFAAFTQLVAQVKSEKDVGHAFKKMVQKRENLMTHGGMTHASTEGTTHSVRKDEQVAFSNWINRNLMDDPDCKRYLPLDPETRDLYEKCRDGILFCKLVNCSVPDTIDKRTINRAESLSPVKMVNKSQPDTIDERTINKTDLTVYRIHENLTLALTSAQSIGCNIVNIGAEDLERGKPHLVLGLLWQIIRIGLLSDINLHEHPGLVMLLQEGETLEEFMKLSPEQILIRWVNYHLSNSPCGRQISNFTTDIKDSVAYIHLLHQIAPVDAHISTAAENEVDEEMRAERMLQEASKIGCRSFVSPRDVVTGNAKLNLAFVANLFNSYPALEHPSNVDLEGIHEETREEKTYRNWMNSMGVSPYVNHLYSDMCDGLIFLQLYDVIRPGLVDWNRVVKKFHKMRMMMEKIENCNYCVSLGKECKFSLVGIDGKDLYDGNQTLTLALVWQLMKAYTLSVLSKLAKDNEPITEKEIVAWANDTLKMAGKKTSIKNFQDPIIAYGHVVIDLVDACKPGSVKYENVKEGATEKEMLDNAKYAISMARKIGARVYALPEDIVEVKSKLVMTVFACIMVTHFEIKKQHHQQ